MRRAARKNWLKLLILNWQEQALNQVTSKSNISDVSTIWGIYPKLSFQILWGITTMSYTDTLNYSLWLLALFQNLHPHTPQMGKFLLLRQNIIFTSPKPDWHDIVRFPWKILVSEQEITIFQQSVRIIADIYYKTTHISETMGTRPAKWKPANSSSKL